MPVIILIGGGSASGKTTFAKLIAERLSNLDVVLLSMDRYYKDLSHLSREEIHEVNFDHPDAIDHRRLLTDVNHLLSGLPVRLPKYDFISHRVCTDVSIIVNADVIIVEGIFALNESPLLHMASLRLFIDTDADIRLARRISRDVQERGMDASSVLMQYLTTVRPMHQAYIEPSKTGADMIVPGDKDLSIARNMVDGFVIHELISATIEARTSSCPPAISGNCRQPLWW